MDPIILALVSLSSLAGTGVGFLAGLIPGLHMNNLAALVSTYAAAFLLLFGGPSAPVDLSSAAIAISSFLSAAMVAHILAESVTSTYVGIPSGDVVSVLPAHRLARSGLGRSAVRASADGALAGVITSTIALAPMCVLMGEPLNVYQLLRQVMGPLVIFFSCVLIVSEAARVGGRRQLRTRLTQILKGVLIFVSSGILGCIVLKTDFYSCDLPDLPWLPDGFVPRDSLLLPLFAGLFGIPSLMLSLSSAQPYDLQVHSRCVHLHSPTSRDLLLSLFGGTIVGWMPGMTSGAAATLCAPTVRETSRREDISSSLRFIWLYSSISGSGAVFALGALFTIARARSGTMDAVELILGSGVGEPGWPANVSVMLLLAISMVFSALIAHAFLRLLDSRIGRMRDFMGSKGVAIGTMILVSSLSVALSGTRGGMVLLTAVLLGLLPPLAGVRRIQLMGSLLVPIAATLVLM